MKKELPVKKLRKSIDPSILGFEGTDQTEDLKSIIGQERAVKSLKFGLTIEGCGYNVYVAGPSGTGKMTSVKSFLEEIASQKEAPSDWCYVHNFDDPYKPKAIELPAGKGKEFEKDMANFVEYIKNELPKAFESDEYMNEREKALSGLTEEREEIFKSINKQAEEKGFTIQTTSMGASILPVKDGEPLDEKDFGELSAEEKDKIEEQRKELQNELKEASKEIRKLEKKEQKEVKDFDEKITESTAGGILEDLKERYGKYKKIKEHLDAIKKDIVENIKAFKPSRQDNSPIPGMQQMKMQKEAAKEMTTKKYSVNLLVDNSDKEGAPVILEFNPTYNNVIGRIEKEMQMGALSTDFTMLKAGALPRANGGYLVLQVEDMLTNLASYDGLKRALRSSEVQIEELSERLGFMATKTLRPEPIPLDLKVIIVGPMMFYQMLHAYDHDFGELFKVKADYDVEMELNDHNIKDFMSFLKTYCGKEKLKHFHKGGAAELIEESIRMADDQEKLSTKFGHIADLIRESNYYADEDNSKSVKKEHVRKAVDERRYRQGLIQDKLKEYITRETLLIDTEGSVTGQINGLSVSAIGNYQFGRPARITATVGAGREGITDIEREAKLGGPIHSKGVLILSGLLSRKYSGDEPLTLSARIVFEQSYQGIDGDSASMAEFVSLVSALSGVPVKQNYAVTGSINQNGTIQAIGGVNEKIEGHYEVCKSKGLTGEQGVIIPESNVKNLMLKHEVVEAVKEGKYHVWSVSEVDEAIELLTGEKAGKMKKDGTYTEGSVNDLVQKRLRKFGKSLRQLKN